ncbi:MAG: aryl-sulfate sulfotransferase [Deltaproteobacteria bacterium]|nr:aryl-sulfate sulfotransferase [Deltaproteobacteria bacterium]
MECHRFCSSVAWLSVLLVNGALGTAGCGDGGSGGGGAGGAATGGSSGGVTGGGGRATGGAGGAAGASSGTAAPDGGRDVAGGGNGGIGASGSGGVAGGGGAPGDARGGAGGDEPHDASGGAFDLGGGDVPLGAGDGPAGEAGTVTLAGHDVKVDPYGTSPLVAVVNLRGLAAGDVRRVEVTVAGQDGGQDFVKTYSPSDADLLVNLNTADLAFPEAGYHVPVVGLYADRENTVRILVDVAGGGRVALTLPIKTTLARTDETAWVPTVNVKSAIAERMEPGWTVAEISIEPNPNPPIVLVDWTRTIAFDERGAIRWALRLDLPKGEAFTLRRSLDGTILTGSFDTVVEVTTLGRTVRAFKLPDHTLNHEIVQIGAEDNGVAVSAARSSPYFGNLLVLASKNGAATTQDQIVELDAATGTVLGSWDLTKVFDPTRMTYIDAERWDISENGDWLHDNGLAYSTADESIIVSGRHQGVAKLRRDGTLVWLLAPHKGWKEPQAGKLLTAVSATQEPYADAVQLGTQAAGTAASPEFDWPFGQHTPTLLPNGDLLIFDNGASRHFTGACGSFSRAVIYRIDEAAMTVRQVAQFLLKKAESSCYSSSAHRLPVTGNILLQPASANWTTVIAKEVTTRVGDDGTVSFEDVVFDATVDLGVIDRTRWYVYSSRGHRWAF